LRLFEVEAWVEGGQLFWFATTVKLELEVHHIGSRNHGNVKKSNRIGQVERSTTA